MDGSSAILVKQGKNTDGTNRLEKTTPGRSSRISPGVSPGVKCVIVIDQDLPLGFIANTAAVLSLSIGKYHPGIIGYDLRDHGGDTHRGITTLPVPILKGTAASLLSLREALKPHEPELTVIDLISATRTTQNYDAYAEVMMSTPNEQITYSGIALFGQKKLVNKFTGNLDLLR